jgi:hypothetical protein
VKPDDPGYDPAAVKEGELAAREDCARPRFIALMGQRVKGFLIVLAERSKMPSIRRWDCGQADRPYARRYICVFARITPGIEHDFHRGPLSGHYDIIAYSRGGAGAGGIDLRNGDRLI